MEILDFPVPSKSRLSLTVDSLVFLSIDATLFMKIAFQIYELVYYLTSMAITLSLLGT